MEFFAITTDKRSSRHLDSYTGLTVHYVNDDYQVMSHILDVCESHTAENVARELHDILGLEKAFGSYLAVKRLNIPCFSHTLQRAVECALRF